MQLRENAEQVALYGGGAREHRRLTERLEPVRRNFLQIVGRNSKVSMAQTAYGRPFDPLSTVAALPLYFTGKVTFGDVTQSASAFGQVCVELFLPGLLRFCAVAGDRQPGSRPRLSAGDGRGTWPWRLHSAARRGEGNCYQ